jgi:NodT family efflux transporter outer membrane factor (OMF) lipoprotein
MMQSHLVTPSISLGQTIMRSSSCLIVFVAAALVGCATGPAYVRPGVTVPGSYKEGVAAAARQAPPAGWVAASPGDTQDRGAWWDVFGDQRLQQLEVRVSTSNQSVQEAVAKLQEARSTVGIARSGYYPNLSAGTSTSRFHTSQNVVGRSLAGQTVSDYSVGLDASWEPDLFSRVKHQVDAAQAREQASSADLAAVLLSIQAELAVDYFDLLDTDAETVLLAKTVTSYSSALALVQNQFDAGVASDLELAQAQTQLETTQSQLIDLGVLRGQLEHAIATLVGEPASTFNLQTTGVQVSPPAIPAGVPSELLERRPDIAAAERRMAGSNADIGEAVSAFYPDLMLSASGGFESSNIGSWLSLPSRFWAIGPALVGTIFDGGRRRQGVNAAQAHYEESVADYRQIVLTAFQEVEDNLNATRTLANEAQTQQRAVDSAERALQIALNRYEAGAVGYLDVVTAQSTALSNERVAAQISRRRMDASVLLVKALGGLWAASPAPNPTPQPQS